MTMWITSVTALTTCLRPSRLRAVVVVRGLRLRVALRVRVQALRVLDSRKVVRMVRAAATARLPGLRRPSAAVRVMALRVMGKPVVKSRVTVVRRVMISLGKSQRCRTRVGLGRRSFIRSRRVIVSRRLSSWINCQGVLAVKSRRC